MPPSNDSAISDALRQLDPLTGLGEPELDALARDAELLEADAGRRLLELGCEDTRQLFLLEGELELTADDGATHIVRAHDVAARGPVSRLRPSRYQVTARTHVVFLLIEQAVLDASTSAAGVIVEESFPVHQPDELLDDSASHPVIYDVFNDINLGRVILPSGADIAIRVGRALHRYELYPVRFVESLMACPALTLKTLRAARAIDRSWRTTRSLREAVNSLGIDKTYSLAVQCVLRETLRTESAAVHRRMQAWWERSVRMAAISRVLARSSERFDPDFAALISLLHGVAEPVILGYADRHPDLADDAALDNVIRGNRAELGRILLSMWDMPREVVDAATLCNHWGYDHSGEADYTDIMLVAKWQAGIGNNGRPRTPPVEEIPAFARLGLESPSPEVSRKIHEAAKQAIGRINEVLAE